MKPSVASKPDSVPIELFLRIKHPSMDPADITAAFGIEPEHTVHAGPAASRSGARRLHSESYWLARLQSQGLQERIRNLRSFSPQTAMTSLTKERLSQFRDSTQYDMYIVDVLLSLAANKPFLLELNREGSTTLLVQREDRSVPLALRTSLALLSELGIALEID
jgi:hypothetical protein